MRVSRLKRLRYYRRQAARELANMKLTHPAFLRHLAAGAAGTVPPPRRPRMGWLFYLVVAGAVVAALWRWVTLWH